MLVYAMRWTMAILTKDQMPKLIPLPMDDDETHRRWELIEDWRFARWRAHIIVVPAGFVFNGASIPKVFSNIFASTGILFLAALIHDFMYENGYYLVTFEVLDRDPVNMEVYVTRQEADQIFEEIADICYPQNTVAIGMAKAFLSVGGGRAWAKCRALDSVR